MKVTLNFHAVHGIAVASVVMLGLAWMNSKQDDPNLRVAMIGNSLMYYNDLPRLLEAMSGGSIFQDSCLHGDASFLSHLTYGNGMFEKWATGQARMWDVDEQDNEKNQQRYNQNYNVNDDDAANADDQYAATDDGNDGDDDAYSYVKQQYIYDYGACTVEQLLLGVDERLVEEYGGRRRMESTQSQQQRIHAPNYQTTRRRIEDAAAAADDDAINDDAAAAANDDDDAAAADDAVAATDDAAEYYAYDDAKTYDDDLYQDTFNDEYPIENDGTNPCLLNENYYYYKQEQYDDFGTPQWDYIILNDNSRAPCCTDQRESGLELLRDVYVPWFLETKAIPIFMVTHGYWSSKRDMSGLTDVPTFASLTYEGYREYAELVADLLPADQQPRLAPVGLAFQLVWEENPAMWQNLIHQDEIHLTPSGTYLEGLIVYATIYGHLPNPRIALNGDVANLFSNARRMTPSEHIQEAYPTLDQARYLYHVASRIINGEKPRSFIWYEN
ncbi:MAG: hypothetical protein SGILL_008017, partial [Bacillariaceae sp.]